ncbi:TOTE conflict system archaeo-eukaryotic primase domain-containing protein [Streptococcus criceti]
MQYYPSYHYGWRNLPPEKRTYAPLTDEVLKNHLRGNNRIGLFPISQSDTCSFLAIDFDKKDWRDAVTAVRQAADQQGVEAYVEISRSGNGAHVWFFFDNDIPCKQARDFGKTIIKLAMQESKSISFSSFDRMFPNQDLLPKGGFGNLIALPLQGDSYKEGRTVFVDRDFKPYKNQWKYLQDVNRISSKQLKNVLTIENESKKDSKELSLSLSNVLKIDKSTLSTKTAYFLKNLASFPNPEFYLKQATRQPTYQTPERIYLFEENDKELRLPRGLLTRIKQEFEQVNVSDERPRQETIQVSFTGQLRLEQEVALSDMTNKENGLLCAETGFGKTVLGAALIARLQKRTIVLVHNRQLLEQWLDRLSDFLYFEEDEAVRYTPSGREKRIGHIGQYQAAKKWTSGLVDVVMIQSLFKHDNIDKFLSSYGMMIVDECHHVTARQFEKVVAQFSGQYLYGLTATPERKNGHEPIVFQRIGEILHIADKEDTNFEKYLTLHLTSFGKLDIEKSKSTNFSELNQWLAEDVTRNKMIGQDIYRSYQEGRKILVLVNRVEHIEHLGELLQQKQLMHVFYLSGRTKRKDVQKNLEKLTV